MSQSLYDKYGGFSTISTIVHTFYDKIGQSQTLAPYFVHANMERLIDHQTKFICVALGGPNNYDGRALEKVHMPLKITTAAFQEVAQYLKESMDEHGMETQDVATVLNLVGSLASKIVTVQ
jgi:hemoglobin